MTRIFSSLVLFVLLFLMVNPAGAVPPRKAPDFDFPRVVHPNDVTIVRDQWGVPHIYGKTDADVGYGLAWANCEDDFETIQQSLLAAKGLLGKVEGKDGAIIDYAMHLVRARDIVEARYAQDLSPEFRHYLDAYGQGFNEYALAHPDEILLREAFPATPQDLIVRYVLSLAVMSGVAKYMEKIVDGHILEFMQKEAIGSNAIAIHPSKTTDGKAYLNINSHQPLEGPLSWYEAHLVSEEGLNIHGGLFPGGVSIFHGANAHLGWAHTVNRPDLVDVYQLEMHPDDKLLYRFDGEWRQLEVRKVKLKVKILGLRIPIRKKVYWSVYGPTMPGKEGTFALRFPANLDIRAAEQWFCMNKATNFTEFKKALEMQALPKMNIVYADRYDTIFYLSNGMVPVRNHHYNWKGLLPGDTSATLWTQYHPLESLPQVLNPDCGYVFNMNNTPYTSTCMVLNPSLECHSPNLGYQVTETNRSLRFLELINQYGQLSWEDFKRIKYDLQLPEQLTFLTDLNTFFELNPEAHPKIAGMLKRVQQWDRRADTSSIGAAIVMVTFHKFMDLLDKEYDFLYNDMEVPEEIYVKAIRKARRHLKRHFGTLAVPLGQVQRHIRGKKEMAVPGFPDVLAAMHAKPHKKGRYRSWAGESFIQLVRFSEAGVEIETVNCYGASNREGSPHYDDQMKMYVNQQTKRVTLDREAIFNNAERIYHPGSPSTPVKATDEAMGQ